MTIFFSDIGHRQHDDSWQPEIQDLRSQIKVALQICGVHNVDDALGLGDIRAVAEQNVASDCFIGRAGSERIEAGKIDQ